MCDLVAIGDITIDLFFKSASFTQKDNRFFLAIGGKYSTDYFHESLGGGGANVAVGSAYFGLHTAVIGKIGENSFKQMIIQKLIKKGVSCEFLKIEKHYVNISSILLTESGERTIIHYADPYVNFQLSEHIKNQIGKTHALYMGNLPGVSYTDRTALLKSFKKDAVLICLNFGITDCRSNLSDLKKLLAYVDILILNTHEYAELIRKPCASIDFKKNSASLLQFDDKIIIITDGEKGSYVYANKNVFHQPALYPKKIIDTTGAGDAYTSGFLASYIKNNDIQKAMSQGAKYASVILSKVGAQ